MTERPNIGDVVRNKPQPELVGAVTRCRWSSVEVRLDTGGLTGWADGNYEPIIVHYYQDAKRGLYRLDVDFDTLQIVGCWVMVSGHWERAPQGTATALEFSGEYTNVDAPGQLAV